MNDFPYLARIEWETHATPITLPVSGTIEGLPPGVQTIALRRDDQYRLVAGFAGTMDAEGYRAYHESLRTAVAGTIRTDGVDAVIELLNGGARVSLGIGGSVSVTPFQGNRFPWTAERYVYRFQEHRSNHPPIAWHTDWFLNGPRRSVLDRATEHAARTNYARDRGGDRKLDLIGLEGTNGHRDHIMISAGDVSFVVHQVPDVFGPGWSKSLGIEYAWKGGAIPEEKVREAIGEIVGFAIGRRLMPIGSTTFDEVGNAIATDAQSPWGDESRSSCERPDDSPFNIQLSVEGSERLEDVLADLMPRYLAARDEFAMKDALWSYWLAKEAPLGLDLPIYSSAVESLKSAWFRSAKTKLKGIYLAKAKFDDLLGEAFKIVEAALKDEPFRVRILRRMKGSFQMGQNEQLDTFFSELGLKIGAEERKAIKGRNAPAHGGGAAGEEELSILHRNALTYKVLFERVFLKMLNYQGKYVDRATVGFPLRNLDDPIGEEEATT